MKKSFLVAIAAVGLVLGGCASQPQPYAFVVDQDKVTTADSLKRQQRNVAHVVWVNPPVRKVVLTEQP